MTERMIDGRPKLPAPEERLALPAPEGQDERRDEPPPPRPWWKRPRFWIILAIVALLALAAWWFFGRSKDGGDGEGGGRPPAVVSVARAQAVTWSDELTAVGTMRAIQGADVTTELPGTVSRIRFANGGTARAGEPLIDLNTATERAQLRSLAAQRNQAQLAYARALRLIERGAIAQAEVEQARGAFESLQAQVEEVRTTIAKKRIEAPFSGRLGIRLVSLGQYLSPGAPIVNLQQIAPIFVNFELPESAIARVRTGQPVALTVAAFGGRRFEGRINALNPQVATNTRNVTIQALVQNRDGALRPGMFADVTVLLPGSRQVVAVPASAVTANAFGDSIYLVARPDPKREQQKQARAKQKEEEEGGFLKNLFGGGESKVGEEKSEEKGGEGKEGGPPKPQFVARTAFVKTGERRGELVEITRGIRVGQPVITAGQLKLEEDAPIQISRQNSQRGVRPVPNRP